jgi:hypothetical protein
MPRRTLLALLLFILPGTLALAEGEVDRIMTAADKTRLTAYAETRKAALLEAKAGAPEEVARLDALVAKPEMPFSGIDMLGVWQCRTIKVGGLLPLIYYDWFKCRITEDTAGWLLEKTSGSQRTTGRFYDESERRLIYLGSFFIAGDKPKPYGSGPETDQVGYAYRTGEQEWRIELPKPYYESKLDILEFRR